MSNTIASPSILSSEAPQIEQGLLQSGHDREQVLRGLLGVDYESAVDTGLLDFFYYDPLTGKDAVTHILGGELRLSKTGVAIPGGFHHAPSVEHFWPGPSEHGHYPTYVVDNPKDPREALPMQPYVAEAAVVGGALKMVLRRRKGVGAVMEVAPSTFFPDDFDAYAVMSSIRQAYSTRDTRRDTLNAPHSRYESFGSVPLPGDAELKLKLVMDFDTERVLAAIPLVDESHTERFTDEQMRAYYMQTTSTKEANRV